jgi:tetratricopeptide (TPR) repeat protein
VLLAAPALVSAQVPPFPSPLEGPGVGELKRSQSRKIERSHREMLEGDLDKSVKLAGRAGPEPAARLALLQIAAIGRAPSALDELVDLCRERPGYAAAWITLSQVAEQSGHEDIALSAARRGADLWPEPTWTERVDSLERGWIDDRIARADRLVGAGEIDAALADIERALALDRERVDALLVKAEALHAGDRIDECLAVLDALGDEPKALLLRGRIAEERERWQEAMEAYSELPADHPERSQRLERAQIRWRMTMLPPYTKDAMSSAELTRGELASVLVATEPRLEALPGGSVPVMSDIVDQRGQREIITVVRLGVMTADEREHSFHPDRKVDASAARRAVDRARALVGLPAVHWCDGPDVIGSGCTPMPSPPSGGAVVDAMLEGVSGAGP